MKSDNKSNNAIIGLLVICLILGLITMFSSFNKAEVTTEQVIFDNSEVLSALNSTNEIVNSNTDKIEFIYNELSKDDQAEDFAKELVLNEIDSKDFYKDIFDILESKTDIEEYKDIYDLKIKDIEVKLNGENAVVYVEFKSYYYLDGDKDETERALFESKFAVKYLDFDENFEDAEVTDWGLDLIKIYE